MTDGAKRPGGISRGELARRTGVNLETIRYYEHVGILAAPPRTAGGHRVYDETHVRTLGLVRRAKNLGFTPEEVRAILDLAEPGNPCCGDLRDIAAHHLEQVRSKIADLVEIERLLATTIEHCSGEPSDECAVIELLENR